MLALFEVSDGHPMIAQQTGVAFNVDVDIFIAFVRSLPGEINSPSGRPLVPNDIVDFDLCLGVRPRRPLGQPVRAQLLRLARVRAELIEPDGITPVRYWPRTVYDQRADGTPTAS